MHKVEVGLDGEIIFHGNDIYPHKREDRTQDEQRIMSQVEVRARYAAQQEFPDADILAPMWDPDYLDRAVEAVLNYPLEDFRRDFRDFYEAICDVERFIDDPEFKPDTEVIYKFFRMNEDNRIVDVAPVAVRYSGPSGETRQTGDVSPYAEHHDDVFCQFGCVEFEDHVTFEEHFHGVVVGHLMAQIRDLYYHMGEMPPEEYQIEGIGKLDINGDGIGDN
ncbi:MULTISPECIES: hypothetical protein [Haloferax]|nr:hypothetical protein [Haloferax mediterranei]MDX5989807.1 hypothetical protein [Haloferax mediterranei ATCC 33500]